MAISQKTERKIFVLLLLIGVLLVMPRFWGGAGNNWDGIFPYWREQIPGWLGSLLSAWNQTGTGGPVGYTTGTLATFVYYPLYLLRLNPELILYLVVSALLGVTAYMSFLVIRSHRSGQPFWLAAVLALLTILNPAIFYKLLAGHLYYLVGYCGFVSLIYFLSKKYPTKVFIPGLGLLLALSGSQIQFFIFSSFAILVWWLFNKKQYSWWAYASALILALMIHSYWIIGFLTGANDVGALSIWAAQNTFEGLSTTSLMRVLVLSFSNATFITKFYNGALLLPGALLVVALPFLMIFARRVTREAAYFMTLVVLFAILATGAFQQFPLPLLSRFYPMLREAGHAAPVFVAVLIFAIAKLTENVTQKSLMTGLGLFGGAYVALNALMFWSYVPRVDFNHARDVFQPFYAFNKTDSSSYRLLTYPFFNQYGFIGQPQTIRKDTPMSNTGWDSFTIFSGKEYIDNAVPAIPEQFQDSVQYRFLQSYDTALLQPYGVRYIYDYSAIYRSNFAKFSSPEVYNNSPNILQNDPTFFAKILEKNPNAKQVAPGIIQLADQLPRFYGDKTTFTKISPTEYRITLDATTAQTLAFLSSYHKGWHLVALPKTSEVTCQSPVIYANGSKECVSDTQYLTGDELSYAKQPVVSANAHFQAGYANAWKIDQAELNGLGDTYLSKTTDGAKVTLALYYQPQANYLKALALSLLTILGSLGYLIGLRLKRK